jgi:hypothetical protein
MPHIPLTPPSVPVVILTFYVTGLAFAALGYLNRSAGIAAFGGMVFVGGVFYTVRWIQAKSKDSN